ncbi:MAG: hypothetical protein Q7R76_04985 [Candidatus Woesearchaeota archaeon]|nr:hypothetical protein [Candidatus Woesearchaeota archaeon]
MKPMNARGVIDLSAWWVELVCFIVLGIGFVFSITLESAFLSYVVIFLFGLLAGRLIYEKSYSFPFYLIGLALLFGYVLGTRYGQWKLVILFFLLGTAVSYYLHTRGYLENV